MKINLDTPLIGLDGKPLTNEGKEIIARDIITNALMNQPPGEQPNGEDSFKRYKLAESMLGKEVDLTPEEIAMIKDRIGKQYTPIIVGPIYKILNG